MPSKVITLPWYLLKKDSFMIVGWRSLRRLICYCMFILEPQKYLRIQSSDFQLISKKVLLASSFLWVCKCCLHVTHVAWVVCTEVQGFGAVSHIKAMPTKTTSQVFNSKQMVGMLQKYALNQLLILTFRTFSFKMIHSF